MRFWCWLFGHDWSVIGEESAPHGWTYETSKCRRCGETTRELVASGRG